MATQSDFSLSYTEIIDDPYPVYAAVQAADPIFWSETDQIWHVLGYAEVMQCALNPAIQPVVSSTDPLIARLANSSQEHEIIKVKQFFENWVSELSSHAHRRVRRALLRSLNPRQIAQWRPRIQALADELFASVANEAQFDFIKAIAFPLPIMVLAQLIGVPESDLYLIKRWSDEIIGFQADNQSVAALRRLYDAVLELEAYFEAIIESRRQNPSDDVISQVLQTGAVSDEELISNLGLFVIAGHETTTGLLGNGMLSLLRHPAQYERLLADDSVVTTAIEEFLRYESSTQFSGRIAAEAVEINGHQIAKGKRINLVWAAANRDPAQFDNPHDLDVARQNNKHLAFGNGAHYCLGAALSRLEAEIIFTTLLHRLPRLEFAVDPPLWVQSQQFRILTTLPVQLYQCPNKIYQ